MLVLGKVDPTLLEPEFAQDVLKLLRESPYTWLGTEGFRSIERSNKLYAAYQADPHHAPRAAPGGKSAHNFGLAIDVALDGSPAPGIQMDWTTAHEGWQWLIEAVGQHPRLHSLYKVGDWPHIEKVNWEKFKDWKV